MFARIVLALLVAAFPLASQGSWAWLSGSAISAFEDTDWTLLQETTRAAFDGADDGERRDWTNAATGNSGAVKPLLSFSAGGRQCRRLAFLALTRKNGRGVATHTLCDHGADGLVYLSPSEHPR